MRSPGFRTVSILSTLAVGILAAIGGCSDPILLPANFENRVDTLTLWAANGTPVAKPSAYLISQRSAVRLDQVTYFDFIFDITPEGEYVLVPLAALASTGRTSGNPGLLPTQTEFGAITIAEQTGYITADTVRIRVSDVLYARSQPAPSCILGIPHYAKLQVLAQNDSARSVQVQVLSNINCGYRGLEPGLPER